MTRDEFDQALSRATKIVNEWPAWKRNILRDSGEPCWKVPRPHVNNQAAARLEAEDLQGKALSTLDTNQDKHHRLNYQIHTAIDAIKLGIVLDELVAEGAVSVSERKCLSLAASAILHVIANANHRHFGHNESSPP